MRLTKMILGFVCLLAINTLSLADTQNQLTFFGTNEYQATQEAVAPDYALFLTNYNLDAQRNLEAMIGSGLPKNPEEAQKIATQRMASVDDAVTTKILYGTALLFKWDIKKIPAFVFGDGEYVVYGITNTKRAIELFLNSRKSMEY